MRVSNLPVGVAAAPRGANQAGAAAHNARLVLTLLREGGATSGAEVARRTGLSPQAASGILRRLEDTGLVRRSGALRGQVGKPRLPYALVPNGAWALGLKVGRRSGELVLADLAGGIRARAAASWPRPMPGPLAAFLERAVPATIESGRRAGMEPARLAGVGVAMPWEVWAWHEKGEARPGDAEAWRRFDLAAFLSRLARAPVALRNDITCAARAELAWGPPRPARDWAYFHVGTFVGGGVVLDGRVRDGRQGNAGAFGSLSSPGPGGRVQLIDRASLLALDRAAPGGLPPGGWPDLEAWVAPWLAEASAALAQAALDVCAVIDFEAVVIDGAFPPGLRDRLVAAVRARIPGLDARGLLVPDIEAGTMGADARALGAATVALERVHFLDG